MYIIRRSITNWQDFSGELVNDYHWELARLRRWSAISNTTTAMADKDEDEDEDGNLAPDA